MSNKTIIAVDAMGGENSPKKILQGIEISLKKNQNNFFQLYGKEEILVNAIKKYNLVKRNSEIINADDVVHDDESPLVAAKKGDKTSMWSSINSQKNNNANITLSAGNTGALLVMSRLILNTLTNIEKPALAGLWPNKIGMNIVLDLGANIVCSDKNLIDFCNMGSALYTALYPKDKAKVALLNVGSEEIKGNENLKLVYNFLKNKKDLEYNFMGYLEGDHIMDGDANVIVTDGFTGNIALKTAEGTAQFISDNLKKSLNILSLALSYFKLK